ncbi:cupin domain-containing protein [Loktanella sp. SALINAS62]|uniref:cupin domain-containing protein n=1 Tax=Loktanella sp. SALINAS62 TaxID=2706124 RepID=UPI001B8D6F48|nr:cupin domain-containing protein [Loktanella sp. SALINAS62]MBS1301503.1 cupin domain-containing protein [Loktanella sp. SALINAS62]
MNEVTEITGLRMGETIRARRKKLKLTLQEVADDAGVSIGYVSLIERDKSIPTLTTLASIAKALGVGIEFFISRPTPNECVSHAKDRQQFLMGTTQVRYERLGASFAGHELTSFIMVLEPGYTSEIVTHSGEEVVFILTGALELTIDGNKMVLAEGDSAHYDAARPHGWSNMSDKTVRLLWTGTIDLFEDRPEPE